MKWWATISGVDIAGGAVATGAERGVAARSNHMVQRILPLTRACRLAHRPATDLLGTRSGNGRRRHCSAAAASVSQHAYEPPWAAMAVPRRPVADGALPRALRAALGIELGSATASAAGAGVTTGHRCPAEWTATCPTQPCSPVSIPSPAREVMGWRAVRFSRVSYRVLADFRLELLYILPHSAGPRRTLLQGWVVHQNVHPTAGSTTLTLRLSPP